MLKQILLLTSLISHGLYGGLKELNEIATKLHEPFEKLVIHHNCRKYLAFEVPSIQTLSASLIINENNAIYSGDIEQREQFSDFLSKLDTNEWNNNIKLIESLPYTLPSHGYKRTYASLKKKTCNGNCPLHCH